MTNSRPLSKVREEVVVRAVDGTEVQLAVGLCAGVVAGLMHALEPADLKHVAV